jgi:hypothetical protein
VSTDSTRPELGVHFVKAERDVGGPAAPVRYLDGLQDAAVSDDLHPQLAVGQRVAVDLGAVGKRTEQVLLDAWLAVGGVRGGAEGTDGHHHQPGDGGPDQEPGGAAAGAV